MSLIIAERHLPLARILVRGIFYAACALALVRALLPDTGSEPMGQWDKVVHASAFYVLTVLGAAAYPRARLWRVAVVIAGLGGLIELLQALPFIHRDASWADWAADWLGVTVAVTPTLVPTVRERLGGATF